MKRGDTPLTGAPSMISCFAIVSDSLYWLGTAPVVSRRMMESSMCLILIRASKKYILPTITSFKWYLDNRENFSKKVKEGDGGDVLGLVVFELDLQAVLDTDFQCSIRMAVFVSGGIRNECTKISRSFTTSAVLRAIVTQMIYLSKVAE